MARNGRTVAIARVGALALGLVAGCSNLDPADRNTRAAVGGVLGAGTGAAIGSVTGSAGRGALIGGAVGTVGGALSNPPASAVTPQQDPYGTYQQAPPGYYAPAQPPPQGYYAPAQQPQGGYYAPGQGAPQGYYAPSQPPPGTGAWR